MKNVLVLFGLVACIVLVIMSCNNTPPATQSVPQQNSVGGVQQTDNVGAIGGTVFEDLGCDGVVDVNTGISGLTVELREGECPSSNPVIATTQTGPTGNYMFTGLQTYTAYCVHLIVPPGWTPSTPNPNGGVTDDYYVHFGLCPTPPGGGGSCGRMTGGGSVFTVDNVRVTRGFEIHCDRRPPNNLEVNWPGGNNFHMTTLLSTSCTDDPAIIQDPPAAPFDTFVGDGVGLLNNVPGATIHFVFVDAGEPGKNDTALIIITDAGGHVVLTVSGFLKNGNIQAHDDGC